MNTGNRSFVQIFRTFDNEKKTFCNHPKIIRYLFNKPINSIALFKNLDKSYDSPIQTVRLGKADIEKLIDYFSVIYESMLEFSTKKKEQPLIKISSVHHLQSCYELTQKKIIVFNILGNIDNQFNMKYTYNWSFNQQAEYLNATIPAPINFSSIYTLDFFGMMINREQLVLFCIQYESGSIEFQLKLQAMTFQMNIHLSWIDNNIDLERQIFLFLKRIKYADRYICQNMKYIRASLLEKATDLDIFAKEYQANHLIYLKLPIDKSADYDSKYDRFYQKKLVNEIKSKPADSEIIVTDDIIEQIIKSKQNYHITSDFEVKLI